MSFATPILFFAGLSLAAIPIVIHFLNRRRFRTVPWAAMEFLLLAMRKNRRRLRFEQWILLATRCLLLVLLGAALARPLACDRSTIASLAGQRNALHVLVIDNSYSMAYEAQRPEAKTHLEQAKRLAGELISRLSAGGESVSIVLASQPAGAVMAPATYDLDAARAAVDMIEQSHGGTDLVGAFERALEIARVDSRQSRKLLHVFSDSTRSAWHSGDGENLRRIGKELAGAFEVTHYNLGLAEQSNHAVLSLRPADNLLTSRFGGSFIASARSFAASAGAAVQWKLDDRVIGAGQMQPTDQAQELPLSRVQIKAGGPHVVSARVVADDDRLRIDDVRHRVIHVTSSLNVLIVEGDRALGPLAGSAAFLQLALAPPSQSGAASDSYIAPEVISDLELSNKVLGNYRAVVLTNVRHLTSAQADQLKHFVTQGGTLLIFMGEQVDAAAYNTVLLPRALLPGALTRLMVASPEAGAFHFDFNPQGNLHPLLRIFYGQEKSGLDTAQVDKYWQIDLAADSASQRVLNYAPAGAATTAPMQNLDPAITLHNAGAGRVVLVTTSANAEWTSFPAKPAYVPLMHEILAGSVGDENAWMNLSVGQPLILPSHMALASAPSLVGPRQEPIALEQAAGPDGGSTHRSKPLTSAGIYTLNVGRQTLPIAVNVAPEEADVRTIDDAAIRSALGDIEMRLESDQLPALVNADTGGNDLGWSFLIAVLALAAAECMMAMTFGHYRRGQGSGVRGQ